MGELVRVGDGEAAYEVVALEEDATLIKLAGELDLATVEELKAGVDEVIAAVTDKLIIDIGSVRFADSSAIAMWVGWGAQVPEIEVRNASALIRRVIDAMGLSTALHVS